MSFEKRWHRIAMLVIACLALTCSNPKEPGKLRPNLPPDTRLANVPPDDPRATHPLFALVTLQWTGSDPDGYIVKYRYRWVSYFASGDSVVHAWIDTVSTKVSLVFESPDSVNRHLFQVKSVDNDGAEDPTPASVVFYTRRALPPDTKIKSGPSATDTLFAIERVTDTWKGIEYTFSGTDPDGEVVEFTWRVDSKPWRRWSITTRAVILASDLDPPLDGVHRFYVKCRDDTFVEDPTPDSTTFTVIVPTWEKGILVLDETRDGSGVVGSPSDAQVDEFYQRIVQQAGRTADLRDFSREGFPSRRLLASYRVLLWHKDHFLVDARQRVTEKELAILREYLNVGGKLWLSGWDFLPHLFSDPTQGTDFTTSFAYEYIHLRDATKNNSSDFTGAMGVAGYPSLALDESKVDPRLGGKLPRIWVMTPRGFGEGIYNYISASQDPKFDGKSCGVRYLGTTYKVVFLGFPLFFMKEEQAVQVAREVLADFGE